MKDLKKRIKLLRGQLSQVETTSEDTAYVTAWKENRINELNVELKELLENQTAISNKVSEVNKYTEEYVNLMQRNN